MPGTGHTLRKVISMYSPTVVGVDPGLVHTGVVVFDFAPSTQVLTIGHAVINGLDAALARTAIDSLTSGKNYQTLDIFIEQYRPRSGFGTDERMLQANADFKQTLDGTLQRNFGVKKIVGKPLLELLHAWSWPTTHHQDLRSAARIAVLGMLLNPTLNQSIYQYVTDNLDGRTWNVRTN